MSQDSVDLLFDSRGIFPPPARINERLYLGRVETLFHIDTEDVEHEVRSCGISAPLRRAKRGWPLRLARAYRWVAEHHAGALRAIRSAGHEIACHSYAHQLVYRLSAAEFRSDTERAMTAIEDACGVKPAAYRAPSYSITRDSLWALEVLAACGFTHDSSIYPIAHDRYGIPGFDRYAHIILTPSGAIEEVPIATARVWPGMVTPIGGGAYLRLLPYRYTAAGIRRINREERKPACIYFHPWELDPDLPRLARGRLSRLGTYAGIESMPAKLERLLGDFQSASLCEVHPCPPPSLATVAQPAATPEV